MSRHVMFAIPSHDGKVCTSTLLSLYRAWDQLQKAGHKSQCQIVSGDSIVPNARNALLAKFYAEKDCTDLFWIDADVWWEGDEALRLLEHPVDFVCGAYRRKKDDEDYPVCWLPDPENKGLWAVDPVTGEPSNSGLIEVAAVPSGFARLTRAVVERMYEAHSDRMYKTPSAGDLDVCALYDVPFMPGHGLVGEDYIFCIRWTALGGKVWLDPLLDLHHTGTFHYRGALASWLKHRDKPIGKAAEDDLRTLRHALCKPEIIKMFDVAIGDAA